MLVRTLFLTGLIPVMALAQGSGSEAPPTALDGYCPVCIVKMEKLVKGTPAYSSVYDGKKYLFPSEEQLKMFKADPEKYADADVALNGYCPVCKVDLKKDVKGKPEFAYDYHAVRYLFPAKEQLEKFKANPQKYAK